MAPGGMHEQVRQPAHLAICSLQAPDVALSYTGGGHLGAVEEPPCADAELYAAPIRQCSTCVVSLHAVGAIQVTALEWPYHVAKASCTAREGLLIKSPHHIQQSFLSLPQLASS